MTKERMCRIYDWFLECDMEFEPEIIIYGFDRFANLQRILWNPVCKEVEALEWLLELENTPDYNNQELKKFKLCEDRESLGVSGFKDSIGYCKKIREVSGEDREEEFKHYIDFYKMRHGKLNESGSTPF